MILLDDRIGSKELLPYFSPYNVPVELTRLDSADAAFFGNGPDGPELIGFERKVISDLATSKRDNRLQGFQFPNMAEMYPNFIHLVVEGIWRSGNGGQIEVMHGKGWVALRPAMMYREIDHFLAELQYIRGVHVERTANRSDTVAYLVSRYKFFNDQSWSQHDRTDKVYTSCGVDEEQGRRHGSSVRSGFIKRTVPILEKQLMQVPGVGADAFYVAQRYGNMERFMEAQPMEIAEIEVERKTKEGRKVARLGPAKARKLYDAERER